MRKLNGLLCSILSILVIECSHQKEPVAPDANKATSIEPLKRDGSKMISGLVSLETVATCFEYEVKKETYSSGLVSYGTYLNGRLQNLYTVYMPATGITVYSVPNPETNTGRYLIIGTDGNDTIEGGAGNDCICAGKGNDNINGRRGNDQINGNEGSDTIRGGRDQDVLRGGKDNDYIYGDLGLDKIYGDLGNDVLYGGTDQVPVRDECYGGEGNDSFPDGSCEVIVPD